MNLFSSKFTATLVLCLTCLHHAPAAAPPISVTEMETLLRFPAQQLHVEDSTEKMRSRKGDGYLSAHGFSGKEGSPLSVVVSVTRAGMIWDANWQAEIDRYKARLVAEQAIRNIGPDEARQMAGGQMYDYGGGGRAYVGLGAVGPGGGVILAYAHLPTQDRDIALVFKVPSKQEKEMTDEEVLWFNTVATNLDAIILDSLAIAVSRAAGVKTAPMAVPWIQDGTNQVQDPRTPIKRKSGLPADQQKQGEADAKANAAPSGVESASGNNTMLVLLGLASLAVIAWFLLKGRGR